MGDKIAFEIVDHVDGFAEGLPVAAAAHQNALGAEHLRHFGQYRGAAVGDHIVGKAPQQRVGGNARQSIRTAALQAELQLAQAARLAAIVAHLPVQLVQQRQPGLHLVVLLLAHHKAQPPLVRYAQRGAKGIHLIVLAPQPDNQHRAGVGMACHVLQHDAGVGMILPQLRTAELMAEQMHAVNPLRLRLLQETLLDLAGDTVDATDGRHDPQLVADAHCSAGPAVQQYLAIRRLRRQRRELRLVTVTVQIAQVGFGVLRMNMLPRRNG